MSEKQSPIYLDHNATTPVASEVVEAMLPYLTTHFGNPGSSHAIGRAAREGLERARAQVAGLIRCTPAEVVFLSGGTEANHLALHGASQRTGRNKLVASVVEHPSVARTLDQLSAAGAEVSWLPVDGQGQVRLAEAATAIDGRTALVSVMHAHNEVGAIQPIAQLAELSRAAGAWMHTDASQSLGKVAVEVDALGVDLLTIAGHKLYAPKGIGALYIRAGTPLSPQMAGGGQEGGMRSGTPAVAQAVALGAAAQLASRDLESTGARLRLLRERLFEKLSRGIQGLRRHGGPDRTLPNTLLLTMPGASGAALLAAAPQVCGSTGSACHDGAGGGSAVLTEMGVPLEHTQGPLRLSLGRHTTQGEVDRAAALLVAAYADVGAP
jgi:cysteine desulfurase